MRFLALLLALFCAATPARAGELVATRMLPAGTILAEGDVAPARRSASIDGAVSVVGLMLRVPVAADAPVPLSALTRPEAVRRNDAVEILYRRPGLVIRTQGRSLGTAALGEPVRVLNLSSREPVSGIAIAPGVVEAGGPADAGDTSLGGRQWPQ
jgi:flagella basal body P-ring formation protein FlgA